MTAVQNGSVEVPVLSARAEEDPWALPELVVTGTPWKEKTTEERGKSVVQVLVKIIILLGLLYLFICSLDFLSDSFRLIGGRTASQVFAKSELLRNPVVGLMMGSLVTVLVQSSSTSTSIIVSMIASGLLKVRTCIPMIMGANIGTSITNTIVSLTQMSDRNEFRRAFGGATVHDMFNWLNVISLLFLEVVIQKITPSGQGYLEYVTDAVLNSTDLRGAKGSKLKLLKVITKPLTSLVVKLDKKVLNAWAINDTSYDNSTLIKRFCKYDLSNSSVPERCHSLFSYSNLPDLYVGLVMLALSLVLLCGCLIFMVKLLHSMLRGSIAVIIRQTLNANIPYMPWLTGYLAIAVGCGMTILVQSSSVFTSAMTPLVGVGVVSLERMYPLTLGSNIGTTTTAILAALTAGGSTLRPALQIALVHFAFNLTGILLFYVVPCTRIPVPLARALGNITAKYRWFAGAYLLFMFVVAPLVVFGLSLAGSGALYTVLLATAALILIVCIVNTLQKRAPHLLPSSLQSWHFLPEWLRSLQPYDRVVSRLCSLFSCGNSRVKGVQHDVDVSDHQDQVQREKQTALHNFHHQQQQQQQQQMSRSSSMSSGHDNAAMEMNERPPVYRVINTD